MDTSKRIISSAIHNLLLREKDRINAHIHIGTFLNDLKSEAVINDYILSIDESDNTFAADIEIKIKEDDPFSHIHVAV